MQINRDLISVIMPVYNSQLFLKRSINSVLNQTYKNIELIIVDDCSTDNSYKIIKAFSKIDKRIRYYKTRKNSGTVAVPRNLGIEKAQGNYFAFIDSDDFWDLNKLVLQITSFKKDSLISCTACNYVTEKLKLKSGFLINNFRIILQKFFINKLNKKDYKWLYIYNPIIISSVLIKKKIFKNNKFNEDINAREDLDFWLKITNKSKNLFSYNSQMLLTIERRSKSLSSNYLAEFNRIIFSISNDFIHKDNYKSFSFFLIGIFLKVLKSFLKKNYLIFRKYFYSISLALCILIFSVFYSPLIWHLGKNLLYHDKISSSDAVVIFSGHGGNTYFNDTYMKRFQDTLYYLENIKNKNDIMFIILGRLREIPEQKILESLLITEGIKKKNIIISYDEFESTKDQIIQVGKILKSKSINNITFVTSPYHTLRSKKLWEKNTDNIKVNMLKTLDWPKKNNFFEKSRNNRIIFYQIKAYIYNLFKGWI